MNSLCFLSFDKSQVANLFRSGLEIGAISGFESTFDAADAGKIERPLRINGVELLSRGGLEFIFSR